MTDSVNNRCGDAWHDDPKGPAETKGCPSCRETWEQREVLGVDPQVMEVLRRLADDRWRALLEDGSCSTPPPSWLSEELVQDMLGRELIQRSHPEGEYTITSLGERLLKTRMGNVSERYPGWPDEFYWMSDGEQAGFLSLLRGLAAGHLGDVKAEHLTKGFYSPLAKTGLIELSPELGGPQISEAGLIMLAGTIGGFRISEKGTRLLARYAQDEPLSDDYMAVLRRVMDGSYLTEATPDDYDMMEGVLHRKGLVQIDASGLNWELTEEGASLFAKDEKPGPIASSLDDESMAVLQGILDGSYSDEREAGRAKLNIEVILNRLGLITPDDYGRHWKVTEKGGDVVFGSEDDPPTETGVGTTEHEFIAESGYLDVAYTGPDGTKWEFECPLIAGTALKLHYTDGNDFTLIKTDRETGKIAVSAHRMHRMHRRPKPWTEEDAKVRRDGWRAAAEMIREEYREGCLIVLRGIASEKPFSTPPKYFGVPLVKELADAGLIRQLGNSGIKAPAPFVLTPMGEQMLADNPEEADD